MQDDVYQLLIAVTVNYTAADVGTVDYSSDDVIASLLSKINTETVHVCTCLILHRGTGSKAIASIWQA